MRYTLILYIRGLKIEIPEFGTEDKARMAGIYLQLANYEVSLFEVKEIKS